MSFLEQARALIASKDVATIEKYKSQVQQILSSKQLLSVYAKKLGTTQAKMTETLKLALVELSA